MTEGAAIETLARRHDAELHPIMLDRLRELDLYVELRARALAKRKLPAAPPRLPRAFLTEWYFATRLGIDTPGDVVEYTGSLGIEDVDKFYALIEAEFASQEPTQGE